MMTPLKVIVVDDEEQLRKLFKLHITSLGCEVCAAENGHEAFRLIQKWKPDLVISDLRMPDGDGLELLRKIKASVYASITVVLISGFTDADKNEVMAEGAFAFIKKPFNLQKIQDIIHKAHPLYFK